MFFIPLYEYSSGVPIMHHMNPKVIVVETHGRCRGQGGIMHVTWKVKSMCVNDLECIVQ